MATNTNAPGNINTGFQVDGITSMFWGTGGAVTGIGSGPTGNGGYFVVVSIDESQKVDQVYVENATGVEAARILLLHGTRWNFTVIDDTAMTPPTVGSQVTIWKHTTANNTATATATVINNDFRAARKTEGQRVVQVEKLTLISTD